MNDPFLVIEYHSYHIFFAVTPGATLIFGGVSVFVANVAGAPLPWYSHIFSALAGTITFVAIMLISGYYFDVFPFPFATVTLAATGLTSFFTVFFFQYPKALRESSEFRKSMLIACAVCLLDVGAACFLSIFSSYFAGATAEVQVVLAFVVPFIKFFLKYLVKRLISRSNPDFAHGAAFITDCFSGSISTILFTSIKNPVAFICMILIDVAENFFFVMKMVVLTLHGVDYGVRVSFDILQEQNSAGNVFLSSHHEAVLASLTEVLSRVDDLTVDPQVAYICGNLFFSELVESIQPMIMASSCLAIYYSPIANNCRFFTFMNGISEQAFLMGMIFVLIEATIQFLLSFFLLLFLRIQLSVDVFRVGGHILNKNRFHFWYMSCFSCVFFLSSFLQLLGNDSTFKFAWLSGNAMYIPSDAQEGMCQLFNLETFSDGDDLSECVDECFLGVNVTEVFDYCGAGFDHCKI